MNRNLFLLIATACLGIGLLGASPATAQAIQKDSTATTIKLSVERLKAFEGYFQSPQNKEMVVQFSAVANGLFARLLWNNGEVHLTPESDTGFVSKEGGDDGPIHIVFQKDSSGAINQVSVARNGVWNRVRDYEPAVKKEMEHTPAQLAQFSGFYQLQGNDSRFLQFSEKENKLVLKQMWDGNEIRFLPESGLSFFSREIPQFTLDFSKDKDGNITQVLAFKHDTWIKSKAPALTSATLKSYQGKYQSEDDPDNLIRIIAKDSMLVLKQLWNGKDIPVNAVTDTYFYNADQSYPLQIVKGQDGKVKEVVLLDANHFKRLAQ